MSSPEDPLWEQWFDAQYELTMRIDKAIEGVTGGWNNADGRAARAALYAAVLEHCGERIRSELDMYKSSDG